MNQLLLTSKQSGDFLISGFRRALLQSVTFY